jgi:hypothetical protein
MIGYYELPPRTVGDSDATSALFPLLELDRLQGLVLRFYDLDINLFQVVLDLVKKNAVISSVCSRTNREERLNPPTDIMVAVEYYSCLNRYGRGAFQEMSGTKKEKFVASLVEVVNANFNGLGRYLRDYSNDGTPGAKASVLNGLIREHPAHVASFALEDEKGCKSLSGQKRKRSAHL